MSFENNIKMFSEKESEELFDNLFTLEDNESSRVLDLNCDVASHQFNSNYDPNTKNLANINNKAFGSNLVNLNKLNGCLQMDLLSKNYDFNENGSDYGNESPISSSPMDSLFIKDEILIKPTSIISKKEGEIDVELKEVDERRSSPDIYLNNLRSRNTCDWVNFGLWHSGPSNLSSDHIVSATTNQDLSTVFTSSLGSREQAANIFTSTTRTYSHQQLGAKVEMVYNLLAMLGGNNREDMSKTFLAMSSSPESCQAMRQSGCLPLLMQLIYSYELDLEVRNRAAEALRNIVYAQTDDKRRRREIRVLKLLQQIREYCENLKSKVVQKRCIIQADLEKHPVTAIGALMKFSFDAEHRQAICTLGGLYAIIELIQIDHEAHCGSNEDPTCLTLRRYAGMCLTNLTFGDGKNKTLLCSFDKFMWALVDQLKSSSEDLRQVTASVLRNLSWRADSGSKEVLRRIGAVTALTTAAMEGKKESTLKSILSALWNLSAHCSANKVDICTVPGALAFLIKMLRYKSTSNTLAIVENAGGIIRNISCHIAVREDYRQILRDNNCFEILLEQLKSPSLTIVSNACGTLWNLSARCSEDQKKLWEMGAPSMLRNLVQSKHKMISMGSSAALKNLITANPNGTLLTHLDSTARSLGLQNLPTLFVRKQRALEQEIDITLAETCDNIEFGGSPNHVDKFQTNLQSCPSFNSLRSDSRESIRSTKSDSVCEKLNQMIAKQENKTVENKSTALHESLNEKQTVQKTKDQKFIKRYKTSMIPTPVVRKINQEKNPNKGIEKFETTEKISSLSDRTDSVIKNNAEAKDKLKRGIPVLKTRSKNKMRTTDERTLDQNLPECDFSTSEEYSVNPKVLESNMESCDVISTSEIQNSAKMELSEFNLLAKCSTKGQDDHCTSEHVLKNTKKNFLDEKSYSLNSELNQNNKKNNNDDCFCRIEECKAQKVFHLHSSNENNLDLIPSATNYINANVIDMAPNLCENTIYTNRKMKNDSESSINCKNRGIHSEEHLENEALLTEPSEINVMPGSSRDEKDLDCLERDASTLTFENTSCNVFRRVEANELLLSETPVYKNRLISAKDVKLHKSNSFCDEVQDSSATNTTNVKSESAIQEEIINNKYGFALKDSYNERTESFPKQLDVKTSVPDVSDFSFDLKDFKEANKCFHGSNSSNINCNENYSSTNASSDSCLLNIKVDTVSFPSDSHMNTLITESESDNKEINTPEKTGISWKSEINDLGADKAEQQNIGEDLKHNSMILESDILKHCEFSKTQDSSNDFAKLENDKIPNEIYCTNFCNNIASTLEDKSGKTEVTNSLSEKLNNLSDIVPNFKIGSEITNVKFFHLEASKICHEIQKYQDSDMGCSLNSQMSVVSGSSFLDVGDHSLFDFTNDIEDFYESDNNGKEKIAKLPAFSGKKSVMITSNDNVSLPSLGSFKANPIDTIDLESSIISIASIASEIADINFNQNSENTFTITNKVCGAYDSLKEDHSSNLRSVDECFDEDNSLNCQENLPYDSEGSKDFSTTDSRKKMTPRERRKTFQDRYRTYTIRDLKSNIVTKANPGQEAIKFSSHGKNFIDGIKYFNPALDDINYNDNHEVSDIEHLTVQQEAVTSANSKLDLEALSGSYVITKDKCEEQEQDVLTDSKSLNDLLSVGPAERKELVDNAKLVALSLKTAIQENDLDISIISDSDVEYSEKMHEIDTATYNKDRRMELLSTLNPKSNTSLVENLEDKGPKISKSLRSSDEKKEELSKGVRGRRKKLYSSPLKKTMGGAKSTPGSPKIIPMAVSSKNYNLTSAKSLPNVPKSISNCFVPFTLQREGTFTKTRTNFSEKSTASDTNSICKNSKPRSTLSKPAFQNKSVPVLKIAKSFSDASKVTRTVSEYGAKNIEKNIESDINKIKSIYPEKKTEGISIAKKGSISKSSSFKGLKNSSSSQNLKSNNGAKTISSVKSQNVASEITKYTCSNSTLYNEKGKPKTPKKEVTSKIANLWKRTEESKEKNKFVKDSRMRANPEKNSKPWDEACLLEHEEILEIPTGKIVHIAGCSNPRSA